jgi:hypothetical protein
MNAQAWVTVITALTTTLGAITALIVAIRGLSNSTPVIPAKPVEPPVNVPPVIPPNPISAP